MSDGSPVSAPRARALAFYLPQFHPIPENDAWWGKGFTEWTNVVAGRPRFAGHYQPHLPADLGFYDLRVAETRAEQADLARRHGIEGFCYYHYWFGGKRLLGRPLDELLASGTPDFPFCLCWANQSWSRAWSGRNHDVLVHQSYDPADFVAHMHWLGTVFEDRRYLTVDGRPLFLVYLPEDIPGVARAIDDWRRQLEREVGRNPWLCGVRTGFSSLDSAGLKALGFDGIVEFEPNRHHFPRARNATGQVVGALQRWLPAAWYDALRDSRWLQRKDITTVVDYGAYVAQALGRPPAADFSYPVVFPSWDNTARRAAATVIENGDPALYERWLGDAVARVAARPPDERLVFINAWNEWAEGCHLEPDRKHGHAFLQATASALGVAPS